MNPTATEADLVETYALRPDDPIARDLVARWYVATTCLRAYIETKGVEPLDLNEVSTLAEMFVEVAHLEKP